MNVTIVTNGTTATAGVGKPILMVTTFHTDDDTLAERIIAAEASIATGSAANGQVLHLCSVVTHTSLLMNDGDANDTLVVLTGVDLTDSN